MRRRGPIHWTGKARSLKTGSVIRLSPPSWSSTVEWPIQVAVSSSARARGWDRVRCRHRKAPRGGDGTGGCRRRSRFQARRARHPCGSLSGHGFRNLPSGPRRSSASLNLRRHPYSPPTMLRILRRLAGRRDSAVRCDRAGSRLAGATERDRARRRIRPAGNRRAADRLPAPRGRPRSLRRESAPIRPGREGHPRALGPAPAPGGTRPLRLRAESDDLGGGVRAVRRGTIAPVPAGTSSGRCCSC